MGRVEACRICLITDVKMERIQGSLETNMKSVFGHNMLFSPDMPDYSCYECSALISKFSKFKKKYFTAQSLLFNILQNHGMVTEKEIKNIDRVASKLNSNLSTKLINIDQKVEMKKESDMEDNLERSAEDEMYDSGSEDDVPLQSVKQIERVKFNSMIKKHDTSKRKTHTNTENDSGESSNKMRKLQDIPCAGNESLLKDFDVAKNSMKRVLALAFDESYDEEERVRRPRWIREREEHFDTLNDKDFVTRFRLTKPTVLSVLESIKDKLEFPTNINNSVSPINQLLCALRFYATGCYQMTAADFCGCSTSTAHRIVHRVSVAIALLRPRHIYFPELPDEVRQTQIEFSKTAKFPHVIGAIGCTHVKYIKSPGGENPEIFRNRKNYFSLNIQAICNAKLEFTDVVARWPGSTHDSNIFNNCNRRAIFEQGRYGSAVLVGDASYACNSYMMTPLEQCDNGPENLYNESHVRTRNCVEKLFEVWKRRFPAMATGLGVSLQNSFPIIIATTVLHNIAIRRGEATPPNDDQVIKPDSWNALIAQGNISNGNMDTGRSHRTNPNYRRRSELVTNYFARLTSEKEENSHH